LYPDSENKLKVEVFTTTGILVSTDTINVDTDPLPDYLFPNMVIYENIPSEMQPGFTLISSFHYIPNVPFMIDSYGNVRWYLNVINHPDFSDLRYMVGIEQLQNGNLYFFNKPKNSYYEIDLLGNKINEWEFPAGYTMHHNIQEKPDGNFLVTANKENDLHLNQGLCMEDHILELDRETGGINHNWDLKYYVDAYRDTLVDIVPTDDVDWFHGNAVIYDATDNTIIVSGRHQGVVKIGYDDEVKWILGNHTGWGQNRNGDQLDNFLLTAVDASGLAYDENVQNGNVNHADFEWNWYQHSVLLMPNGNLMLFDNGEYRNFNFFALGEYSRAVEFEIDETNKTVKQIWSYGKDREKECFARFGSDVDYDPATNNVLFAPGNKVEDNGVVAGGRIVELDYTTKQVVFEALIYDDGMAFQRVERIDLLAK